MTPASTPVSDHRPRDTPLVEEKQLACLPLSEAMRRAIRYSALADAHTQATPEKPELSEQPVWVCETSSYILLLLSPAIGRAAHRITVASPTARKEIFRCNKNSFGVFTPSSSMQNRKAWHIAFYGYKRSRWRFFVFSDNCAHNINTTLPNRTLLKEGQCLIYSRCISPGKTEPTTAYWTRPLNNQMEFMEIIKLICLQKVA